MLASQSQQRTCDSSGRMVTPAWPPTTGTDTSAGSTAKMSPMNCCARTTSSFVTPSSFLGSYVPVHGALYRRALALNSACLAGGLKMWKPTMCRDCTSLAGRNGLQQRVVNLMTCWTAAMHDRILPARSCAAMSSDLKDGCTCKESLQLPDPRSSVDSGENKNRESRLESMSAMKAT